MSDTFPFPCFTVAINSLWLHKGNLRRCQLDNGTCPEIGRVGMTNYFNTINWKGPKIENRGHNEI